MDVSEEGGGWEKISGDGERDAGRGTWEGVRGRDGVSSTNDTAAFEALFSCEALDTGLTDLGFTLDEGFLVGEAMVASSSSGMSVSYTFGRPA